MGFKLFEKYVLILNTQPRERVYKFQYLLMVMKIYEQGIYLGILEASIVESCEKSGILRS